MFNTRLWLSIASMLAVCFVLVIVVQSTVWARTATGSSVADAPASIVVPSPVAGATRDPDLAIDANGRRHVVFRIALSGEIIYATCAANCSSAANWISVQVGINGALGTRPLIALTPDGRPRLMYVYDDFNATPKVLIYNTCESNCSNPSSWTELAIVSDVVGSDAPFFALDPQGRPRAVVRGSSSFLYLTCDANCATSASNWFVTALTPFSGLGQVLTIDSAGNPHLLYQARDQGNPANDVLVYASCNERCTDGANWFGSAIFALGIDFRTSYALATNRANHPRIAFFTGNLVTDEPALANVLAYAWCDHDCGDANNWGGVLIGTPQNEGVAPSLVLDANDRLHLSYYNDASGFELGYATCTANCESMTGRWIAERVESPLTYPNQPAPGCTLSSWYVIGAIALAFNPVGEPQIAFVARNVQTCNTVTSERLRQVRFIDLGTSAPLHHRQPQNHPTATASLSRWCVGRT